MHTLKNIGLCLFAVCFTLCMLCMLVMWIVADTRMRIKFKWNAKPEGLLK